VLVRDALLAFEEDERKKVRVFLSGCTTSFPGFKERLINELTKLVPSTTWKSHMSCPNYDTWQGASKLCDIFGDGLPWLSRDDYFERG